MDKAQSQRLILDGKEPEIKKAPTPVLNEPSEKDYETDEFYYDESENEDNLPRERKLELYVERNMPRTQQRQHLTKVRKQDAEITQYQD